MNPLEAVVAADPYPYYASLVRERPFAYDGDIGAWVAAGAVQVDAVLRHPDLRVRPPTEPVPSGIVGTAAGEVFSWLVRMTDGDEQRRLKEVLLHALGTVDRAAVRELALVRAGEALDAGPSELMFGVPARVVGALCGLEPAAEAEAAMLVADFVKCIPATATVAERHSAAAAARGLRDLLVPPMRRRTRLLGELVGAADAAGWESADALLANTVGLLSQTHDATAALIGNSLVALARELPVSGDTEAFVREVARYDAPVQNTRRFAAGSVRVAGMDVKAGETILVLLAAANRDPAANEDPGAFRLDRSAPRDFGFGAGVHECPGRRLAITIAVAVVDHLLASGFDVSGLPTELVYRPSANARIPLW